MHVDSPFIPHGRHFIGGERIATPAQFQSAPAEGPLHSFSVGTPVLVDQACRAAEEVFGPLGLIIIWNILKSKLKVLTCL